MSDETEVLLPEADIPSARKVFSCLALGVFVLLAAASAAQIGVAALAELWFPGVMEREWGLWLCTFVPIYAIGVPLALLVMRRIPAQRPAARKLPFGTLMIFLVIAYFMMYAGNLLGLLANNGLSEISGTSSESGVLLYAEQDSLLPKILFMVVLGPLAEEFVFRRTLIDRMRVYGEGTAVAASALMFGLFHGNVPQFFYAAAVGLMLGYVYLKTGKLRYSLFLHMAINLVGSVIAPMMLELVDLDALEALDPANPETIRMLLSPRMLGYFACSYAILGMVIAGLVLFCMRIRQVRFEPAPQELPRGKRFSAVCVNWGMLLLLLISLGLVVLSCL